MSPDPVARLTAVAAALEAVEALYRAQQQHYACMMDVVSAREDWYHGDSDSREYSACIRARDEARAQVATAQAAATAALAAVSLAADADDPEAAAC